MTNGFPGEQHNPWSHVLASGRNRFGFALRNFLRWTLPGAYRETACDQTGLPELGPDAARLVDTLHGRYDLPDLTQAASRERYLETLAYLEWLEYFRQKRPAAFSAIMDDALSLRWLDAGAKNWAYVEALYAFIQANHGPNFQLDGVELDPHRRYVNLQTRQQAALSYIQDLPNTRYHSGNLLDWRQPAHIISHFLPFVFKEPHLAWGLPLNYFNPQLLLNHLLSRLEPGGLMLIVNQGEAEAQAQQVLLEEAARRFPLQFESLGQLPASFIEYRYPRYGWLCIKDGI